MATDRSVALDLKTAAFQAAIRRFLRKQAPEVVDIAVRKLAADVVAETVKGITTVAPTRVDTGRYRAGWGMGARAAGLDVNVPSAATSRSGDGAGEVSGRGLSRTVTVANNVEYALPVEVGTAKMAAGNHLTRALVVVRRAVPGDKSVGSIAAEVKDAWKR